MLRRRVSLKHCIVSVSRETSINNIHDGSLEVVPSILLLVRVRFALVAERR